MELATKIVPLLIGVISGETGPSQTDRVDGIDLNGEDPFSWRNIVNIGLKVFLAIVSSQSATEKSDGDWLQVRVDIPPHNLLTFSLPARHGSCH